MGKLNRKQRRQLNKIAGKKATSTIDLMLGMPSNCLLCNAPYDKMSKEMAITWFVEVYKSTQEVKLYCPICQEKRTK